MWKAHGGVVVLDLLKQKVLLKLILQGSFGGVQYESHFHFHFVVKQISSEDLAVL